MLQHAATVASPEALLPCADHALYAAKMQSRNRFFSDEMKVAKVAA